MSDDAGELSGRFAVRVKKIRAIPSPFDVAVWLEARLAIVDDVLGQVPHVEPGAPVIVVGPPISDDVWHGEYVRVSRCSAGEAARQVLLAHALYLLRRAGARGGERVVMTAAARRVGLGELANAYGLEARDGGASEWAFWTGNGPDILPWTAALWLAGAAPSGSRVLLGPKPPTDPRMHVPVGEVRWPLSRCLSVIADSIELALPPEPS